MTTRYEAPFFGVPDESIVGFSKISRAGDDYTLRSATIHDGGNLEIKHPNTGKSYIITDDEEVEKAAIKMPSGTTLFVSEAAAPITIDNIGTVQYMGPGRTN